MMRALGQVPNMDRPVHGMFASSQSWRTYHLLQNNYSFDALQPFCFGINLKL